jgi:hypothetical protein
VVYFHDLIRTHTNFEGGNCDDSDQLQRSGQVVERHFRRDRAGEIGAPVPPGVDFGTLRSCFAAFNAKPDCKTGLYSIQTDDTSNLPKTTLFRQDIEALLN